MPDMMPQSLAPEILYARSPIPFFIGDLQGNIRLTNAACRTCFGPEGMGQIQQVWKKLARQAVAVEEFEHNQVICIHGPKEMVRAELQVFEALSPGRGERFFPAFLIHPENVRALKEEVQSAMLVDALTGLPNRHLGQDRLQKLVARLVRSPEEGFTLIYLDLVDFKKINDECGHGIGDEILKAVADRLSSVVRQSDTVCRWGGDEFVLLLEGSHDLYYAQKMSERIVHAFVDPFIIQGVDIEVGVSLGVVFLLDPRASMQEMLEVADRAMYEAKSKGPNSYIMIKHIPGVRRTQKNITREIGRAMENEEFFVHYQPIINLQTMSLAGVEAFIRWNHPTRGVLYPAEFMAGVETSPLAVQLGEWVIGRACRTQCRWKRRWPAYTDIGMHINISSQLMDWQVFKRIQGILQDADIHPSCIYLDCLKASFLKDRQQAALASNLCHDLGINLVLDDMKINLFNLNFFYNFHCVPFRMVKVNGNVVDSVRQENTTMMQSIRTFSNILAGMGVKMAVKGIENHEQFQSIVNLKCYLGQGYYFSPPLSEEEFENTWFTNNGPKG